MFSILQVSGSSNDETCCNLLRYILNTYNRGATAGSEPETQSLIAHVSSVARKQGIKLYIDWHSFGNYIISPWGYTCAVVPQNNNEMTMLARETGDVIESVYGTAFT